MSSGACTGMSDPPPNVVCDAGPLIHLDELACLPLLADFPIVFVPEQVWQEVGHHRPKALIDVGPALLRVPVVISEQAAFQALVRAMALGVGEQAALSLMQQHSSAIFLTDDAAARLAATTLGYRVHGTIGILLRAIRRQQRTRAEVLTTLRSLPVKSTLRVRAELLQGIIAELEIQRKT